MRAFAVTLSLAYLLLAHAATLTGLHWPRLAAVAVLCVLLLALLHGRVLLQLLLGCALAGCLLMAPQPLQLIMYATPVLVPLALGAMVARTLRPGRQPMVERIVWHLHDRPERLDEPLRRYARAVTVYWCGVFALMALVNLLLALYAPPALWSWVANIAAYGLPLLAMLAEYAWRRRVFPKQPYRNLFDFLVRMIRLGPVLAAEFPRDARQGKQHAPPALHP